MKKPLGPLHVPPPPVPAEPLPQAVLQGAVAVYQQYLPMAMQIPDDQAVPYRQDPSLAYQNIMTGQKALEPHASELKLLPGPFNYDALLALPSIALATIHAAAQVNLESSGIVRQLMATASPLRRMMLTNAEGLMEAGIFPAPEVRHIIKGSGSVDLAQDCVDLAELYTKHAAEVAGKTPITQDHIDQASQVGNQLLGLIKPKNAPSKSRSMQYPTVAVRDHFGALLYQQHAMHMRRAGMWLWVDDVDTHVPLLHSHAAAPKKRHVAQPADGKQPSQPLATPTAPTAPTAPKAPEAPAAPTTPENHTG
jgi:hypothetical protein